MAEAEEGNPSQGDKLELGAWLWEEAVRLQGQSCGGQAGLGWALPSSVTSLL